MTETIQCPFCGHDVEIDVEFARKNGRVFCGTCCKSFEVEIPPPTPDVGYKGYYGETF